jgi:sugar lactone lactonase YvrE
MQPELILDVCADLGEGPAWDAASNQLTWVDIRAGDLHIFTPQTGNDTRINLGEPIGCAAPGRAGDMVVALRSGIAV